MKFPVHRIVLLALVALVPAGTYTVVRGDPLVLVAMVNVLIIAGSLYKATSPATTANGAAT